MEVIVKVHVALDFAAAAGAREPVRQVRRQRVTLDDAERQDARRKERPAGRARRRRRGRRLEMERP